MQKTTSQTMQKLLLILTFLACQFMAFATEEHIEGANTGLSLTSDLTVSGSKYPDIVPGWTALFGVKQVKNEVIFGIDNTIYQLDPAYKYKVKFNLSWEEIVGASLVTNSASGIELELDYSPDQAYQDQEVYAFTGGLSVNLSGIQLFKWDDDLMAYVSVTVDRENLFLKAVVETEYYDRFYYNSIPPATMSVVPDGTDWIVKWPALNGAQAYDVEWTWVNGYEGTEIAGDPVVLLENQVSYDFKYNASNIRVTGNEYRIPMVYGDGYLLVRYRGIGRIPTNLDRDIDGTWMTAPPAITDQNLVSVYPASCKILVSGHEDNGMNYSAEMEFVEQGKRSTGVTYLDGVMKPRQNVTQMSSQEELVVGSVLYDYYGRPTIGVMGSPVKQTDLGYVERLNMLNSTEYYDKSTFHQDIAMLGDCGPAAAVPMSAPESKGSANYYSQFNTDKEGPEAFVPEANGYNFAQVHYTNDPTGRIKRSGGVGPDHQLGPDGHYTEVIYETPGENEVDELLGSEAADWRNYTKIISKDVHGQVNVVIVDNLDRSVISYMEGSAPNGLAPIEGNGPETSITVNLVDLTSESTDLLDQGILKVEKKIAVTDPNQVYNFSYDFKSLAFSECLPVGLCFDCLYEIEFTVSPVEGEFTGLCPLTDGVNPIASSWTHTVGNLVSFDIDCDDPITFSEVNPGTFALKFPRFGEYYVTKTLKVSQAPVEYYWEQFVENADPTCLIPYSSFLADAMMDVDFGDCYDGSPCELNFFYAYGSWDEYSLETGETDEAVYDNLRKAFIEDCENQPICAQMLPILLSDVSPGGQYGDVSGASGLSVFNAADPMTYSWRDIVFYETDGVTIATMTNLAGSVVPVNDLSISLSEFVAQWDDHWALSLLGAHPEYQTYRFCEMFPLVADYALNFRLTETYAEAMAAGYITPVNPVAYSANFGGSPVPYNALTADPLVRIINETLNLELASPSYIYDDGYAGYTSNDYMDACQYLLGTSAGPTLYATASALTDGAPFGASTCDLDAQWIAFRDLYLARRNMVLQVAMEGRAMNVVGSSCIRCITYTAPICAGPCASYNPKVKRFMLFDQVMPYSFIQILTDPDPAILASIEAGATADVEAYCASACESMADGWMLELAGCAIDMAIPVGQLWEPGDTPLHAFYNTVKADLITVCKGGCTPEWPFPSQYHLTPPTAELASFKAVLINYLPGFDETMDCNHYLIDAPSPVEDHSLTETLSSCACDKLLSKMDEDSFEATYGFLPDNFCGDRATCADIAGVSLGIPHLPGSISWNVSHETALALEVTLTNYGCGGDGCISCGDLSVALYDFNLLFPGATIEDNPVMFTSFVNELFGTAFNYHSLQAFKANCDSLIGGGIVTEGLSPVATEMVEFMNTLIIGGGLYTFQVHPYTAFPLLLSEVSRCPGDGTGDITYDGNVSGSEALNFTILNGAIAGLSGGCLACPQHSFGLSPESLGGYPNATDVVANLISLGTIYATAADILASGGGLYQFHITGLVNNPGVGDPIVIEFVLKSACIDALGQLDKLCSDFVIVPEDDCLDALIASASMEADAAYGHYLAEEKEAFVANYIETCRQVEETYEYQYQANKYHYTLMYYDRAGNVVKTVSPKGVHKLSPTQVAEVKAFRAGTGGAEHLGAHDFVSTYTFNALNQPIEKVTPDGGSTKFWYDHVGRIAVSQNARQAELKTNVITGNPLGAGYATQAYSYSRYDELGRTIEFGEFVQPTSMTKAIAKNPVSLFNWLFQVASPAPGMGRYRNHVTRIGYSNPTSPGALTEFGADGQGDIRNRVSSVAINEGYTYMGPGPGWSFPLPDYFNHYAYDTHGNVRHHLQEISDLVGDGRQFLQTEYEYDLLSGLPEYAHFQRGEVDQFSHHFEYDADNRPLSISTSKDEHIWDKDASYIYRKDGKLARTELGELEVQGCDFAYTLHGWLKAMNSAVLDPLKDMGKDGAQPEGSLPRPHPTVAQDALAYTIGYYGNDYQSIDVDPLNNFQATVLASAFESDVKELFNGNISKVTTAMMDLNELPMNVTGTTYGYDQLHRFKESHVFTAEDITALNSFENATRQNGSIGPGGTYLGDYEVHVDYDANSNITKLDRRAYEDLPTNNHMDDFSYTYPALSNRLDQVSDAVTGTSYDDIKSGQASGNYQYHSDGSLKSDAQEQIAYLDWYPNGRLKRVYRTSGSLLSDLYFEYDAAGDRILKVEMPRNNAGMLLPASQWRNTWYGKDAYGSPMAIYQKNETEANLHRTEATVYGQKRVGIDTRKVGVSGAAGPYYHRTIGEKMYELSDHLGNVKEVITDRKILLAPEAEYSLDDFFLGNPCAAIGGWFFNETPGTSHALADVNTDGATDLVISNGTSNFSAIFTISTIPGESYTVSYDILSMTVSMVKARGQQCPSGTLGLHNATSPGSYSYSFVATTTTSRLKWASNSGPGMFVLSNVQVTGAGDPLGTLTDESITMFLPDVVSYSDYYPFGMQMPGRKGAVTDYRYAFNGMEHDSELSGGGNSYTTMFRQYDPRLGRWKSIDPLAAKYPGASPYSAFNNNPIVFVDPLGLEGVNGKGPGGGFREWWNKHFGPNRKGRNKVSKGKKKDPDGGGKGKIGERVKKFFKGISKKINLRGYGGKRPRKGFLKTFDLGIVSIEVRLSKYRHEGQVNRFGVKFSWQFPEIELPPFPVPPLSFSVGLRVWNLVLIDIQIGSGGRWESYFPGRKGKKGGGNFYIGGFYSVKKTGVSANYIDGDGEGGPHPLFFTGKEWQLPCIHGGLFKGMKPPWFFNEVPPDKQIYPVRVAKGIFNYSVELFNYFKAAIGSIKW